MRRWCRFSVAGCQPEPTHLYFHIFFMYLSTVHPALDKVASGKPNASPTFQSASRLTTEIYL